MPAVLSEATYFQRGGADAARLAQLPVLHGSEREIRDIAHAFGPDGARLFLGDQASEANLADPGVRAAEGLLFAIHDLVAGALQGMAVPALILSPPAAGQGEGVLTASEIARLDLATDCVILTACDRAAGFDGGVPAFAGLVSAFPFRGRGQRARHPLAVAR